MTPSVAALRTASKGELDELFRNSTAGPIPEGRSRGTALLMPGSGFDKVLQTIIRIFWWRGKIFSPQTRDLKNIVTPLGIPLIRANVYQDESWFAKGPAVILDYSRSSFVAQKIRDEIREVSNGLYLGQVYWGKKRIALFMLEFPSSSSSSHVS
ncbi:MAG: hypothetical protein ACT4P7_15275 [Gemmatimonadaceae bacterium]